MQDIATIHDYLTQHADQLGERILASYPALHAIGDAPSPLLDMLREPYPAQVLAVMGVSKRWQRARNANVVAECGTGKTLIARAAMLVHSDGRPFSGLVMAPPHLLRNGRERPS
jgi:superfamily II DNA or RNA helicase